MLVLNMIDDAKRKGINIDIKALEDVLGIPIVETIAVKGVGLEKVFKTAIEVGSKKKKSIPLKSGWKSRFYLMSRNKTDDIRFNLCWKSRFYLMSRN